MKVLILSGIPGAGKSSWIKALLAGFHNLNVVVCSADDYFMKDGEYKFDFRLIGEAHAACTRKFVKAIYESTYPQVDYIIVDNTSTTPIECQTYVQLALAFDKEVEIVQFNCPAEIGFMRTEHGVPLKSCYHYRDNIDNFQRDMPPFWKHVVTFTKVNTEYTASDIANARVKAREASEKEGIYFQDMPSGSGLNVASLHEVGVYPD